VLGFGVAPPPFSLECQQIRYDAVDRRELVIAQQMRLVAVLGVGVDAVVHAAPELCRSPGEGQDLVEVVVLYDRVESDRVDAALAHGRDVPEDLLRQARYAAGRVMPAV